MNLESKRAFFDDLALRWDDSHDLAAVEQRLDEGLAAFGLLPDETVLDIGCGTGNLTKVILRRLSPAGKVVAVDISPKMVEVARQKIADKRVSWLVADAHNLPLPQGIFDRAICLAVWPHFDDPLAAARELWRVLRPGGAIHIWHLMSRERMNQVHASAGGPVAHDLLPPAAETGLVLEKAGFDVLEAKESEDLYLVTAVRHADRLA